MSLKKVKTIDLKLKPCSLCSFPGENNNYFYGIACYEQNASGAYIGEIFITTFELDIVKTFQTTGGVFRIYFSKKEGFLYAVTTDGKYLKIDPKNFEIQTVSSSKNPYFTDISWSDERIALTSDSGRLFIFSKTTGDEIVEFKAHSLVQYSGVECPAWSCSFVDSEVISSVGDDGWLKIWDLRVDSSKNPIMKQEGPTKEGMVYVESKNEHLLAVGDYGQNYNIFDLRNISQVFKSAKFPGGVWHFDHSLEDSQNISVAACMQGGIVVFNKDLEIIGHAPDSKLSYGVAIHEKNGVIYIGEVEFDDRKLNSYCFK